MHKRDYEEGEEENKVSCGLGARRYAGYVSDKESGVRRKSFAHELMPENPEEGTIVSAYCGLLNDLQVNYSRVEAADRISIANTSEQRGPSSWCVAAEHC